MKAKLAGLLVGIALFATADQVSADDMAPKGCRFEVQVKYVGYYVNLIHRTSSYYSSWDTYASFKSFGNAVDVYDVLAVADSVGKLNKIAGLPTTHIALVPSAVDVRLVMICDGENDLKGEKIYVIETTSTR